MRSPVDIIDSGSTGLCLVRCVLSPEQFQPAPLSPRPSSLGILSRLKNRPNSLSLSLSQTPGNKGEDNIKEKCDEEEEEEEEEPPSGEGGCRVSTHESVF